MAQFLTGVTRKFALATALCTAATLPFAAGHGASLWSSAAQAQSGNNQNDLAQIQRHLKAMTSLRANFVQSSRGGQDLSGKLTLKQPGKIRFQYQKNANLLIVSDGKALTMIDYEVRQVERWPIKNSPLGVLLDPSRDLSRYGKITPSADPKILSVEVKDPKRPEYGVITLIFVRKSSAPAGLEMAGWVALDSQNVRTTVRLSGQRYNVSVANSEFNWTDPRGNRKGARK